MKKHFLKTRYGAYNRQKQLPREDEELTHVGPGTRPLPR